MSNREAAKLIVVFALIGGMSLSLSACSKMGKPTGGAGPVSMQQQQRQDMSKTEKDKIKMQEKIQKDKMKGEEKLQKDKSKMQKDKLKMQEKIQKDKIKMQEKLKKDKMKK